MIDLHIHTTYSDGTDNVIEILKKAEELKLDYISITDHDKCLAYAELEKIDIKKYYSGKIIPGIEIKCAYQGRLIEVLGYYYNVDKMQAWINEYYKDKQRDKIQTKYFNILYEACIKLGLIMNPKEEIEWNPKNDWASFTIYQEFKKHKENKEKLPEDLWDDFTTFTKKYCGDLNSIFHIDKSQDYPSLQEAINVIKECDGLVFLPHVLIYKWAENKEIFIEKLLENKEIDGIECYHSKFDEEQIKYLLNLTEEKGLFRSGGSDYHGENKPNIKLAFGKDNLKIPTDIIKKWVKE